ncbi:MAG: hypothetical protein IJA59_01080 [Clostridia bacterium]|nr:hypothetical protein [Clostridia bacterium]
MKKCIRYINYLLLLLSLISAVCYAHFSGLPLKTLNATIFMLLGLINAGYAFKKRAFNPLCMVFALAFCMAADVTLWFSFIVGAGLFAIGHVFYFICYCKREKFLWSDLIPGAVLFVSVCVLMLTWKRFDYGGALMEGICIGYALIISLMFSKAVSNYRRNKCRAYALMALGSAMFVFSDFMLLLDVFANGPAITDTLCVMTYFPGQSIQAHALYWLAEKK